MTWFVAFALSAAAVAASAVPTTQPAPATGTTPGGPAFKLLKPANETLVDTLTPTLQWEGLQTADRYELRLGRGKDLSGGNAMWKDDRIPGGTTSRSVPLQLTRGDTFFWNAVAKTADGDVAASNGPFSFRTPTFFEGFGKQTGLSLQRSFAKGGEQPAEFSVTNAVGKDVSYGADFALKYDLKRLFRPVPRPDAPEPVRRRTDPVFSPFASLEVHVTDIDAKDSEDAIRLRIGTEIDQFVSDPIPNNGVPELFGHYWSVSGKYEADSDLDVEKLMIEVLWSPTIPELALGERQSLDAIIRTAQGRAAPAESDEVFRTGPEFRWRPILGLDFGRTLDRPLGDTLAKEQALEREDTILRLSTRVRGSIFLPDVARALTIDDVEIFGDNVFYYLPLEDETDHTHNFLTAGVALYFSKSVSLNFTYKVGRDAPKFEEVESVGLALGLKF
jgi:hypothetical protein